MNILSTFNDLQYKNYHRHNMYIHNYCRKFIVESNDKLSKQAKNSNSQEQPSAFLDRQYSNITYPSNKIQCDQCKRDITKLTKIMIQESDYCASCFANVENFPQTYQVINKLDFPLFDFQWNADQQLLLFEGLQKHGFGNWSEIADLIGTNKSRQQVQQHYHQTFLERKDFLPQSGLLSKREQGMIVQTTRQSPGKKQSKYITKNTDKIVIHNSIYKCKSDRQKAILTINNHPTNKTGNNPAQIIGYMPKRGDFEVQYDNDAQLILAEMQFNDEDTEQQKVMKFRLIEIYNKRLNQRIARKQFVIQRKLLDLKQQVRLDKSRTKQQRQIYTMMKVFARFNSAENHEKLVQAIIKQKEIRQKIQQLKDFKRKGFHNLYEIEQELQNKKKKEQSIRKKDAQQFLTDKNKTRRMRKDPLIDNNEKRIYSIIRQQQQLCKKLNIAAKTYILIKETILRESVKLGLLQKDYIISIFKIQKQIIEEVFDYLVKQQQIIPKEMILCD